MIKRIAAIFLIVTATTIFLADFIIPHHHHGSTICFDSSHCSSDDHAGEFPASSSHNHGRDNDCGSCKLKQALMIPTVYQYNELINIFLFASDNLDNQVLMNVKINLLPEIVSSCAFRYGNSPLVYRPSDEGCISGLRAPPSA